MKFKLLGHTTVAVPTFLAEEVCLIENIQQLELTRVDLERKEHCER